jgi:hypothetical protein
MKSFEASMRILAGFAATAALAGVAGAAPPKLAQPDLDGQLGDPGGRRPPATLGRGRTCRADATLA